MENGIPVDGYDGWYRDPKSNAIQCANKSEYEKYMAAHRAKLKKDSDFDALQNEVSELKSDMSDIKSLLLTLVQQKQNNHDD
tara:strand:+ start:1010 stop:1255 length:246 start_codon:yes stop_codon:yes gene_type:complete